MKVATITLYCNESFRLEPWISYYNDYRDSLYAHIIVNNGKKEDTELLRNVFPNSIVLYSRTTNMVASYNLAINYILESLPETDAIFQITNDLKLESGAVKVLHDMLFSDDKIGMVSPILLKKDSKEVEAYGIDIKTDSLLFEHLDFGKDLDEIEKGDRFCSGLPGGCFMTKTSVYKEIGLQDEKLFMYGDEIDIDLRCANAGYRLLATSNALSWHQHINYPGKKTINPRGYFFSGRNYIYLARKHFSTVVVVKTFFSRLTSAFVSLAACIYHKKSKDEFKCAFAFLKGVFNGLFN